MVPGDQPGPGGIDDDDLVEAAPMGDAGRHAILVSVLDGVGRVAIPPSGGGERHLNRELARGHRGEGDAPFLTGQLAIADNVGGGGRSADAASQNRDRQADGAGFREPAARPASCVGRNVHVVAPLRLVIRVASGPVQRCEGAQRRPARRGGDPRAPLGALRARSASVIANKVFVIHQSINQSHWRARRRYGKRRCLALHAASSACCFPRRGRPSSSPLPLEKRSARLPRGSSRRRPATAFEFSEVDMTIQNKGGRSTDHGLPNGRSPPRSRVLRGRLRDAHICDDAAALPLPACGERSSEPPGGARG